MKCTNCDSNEGIIKITQITNNQKKEVLLCSDCAQSEGMNNPLAHLSSILGGVINDLMEKINETQVPVKNIVCPNCSMTLKRFMDTALLGCGHCYETFGEELKRILHRFHGFTEHKLEDDSKKKKAENKRKKDDTNELMEKLAKAVKAENFEMAAELRDRIDLLLYNRGQEK